MTQTTLRPTTARPRQLEERSTTTAPSPHLASAMPLRTLGALSLLLVGAVHLEQYFAVHFQVVPVIGPLFLLNFVGATAIGSLLLLPLERRHSRGQLLGGLLALGGIGLAATSFVFVFVSENHSIFGFRDYGYRPAIIIALAAEAATVLLLSSYLGTLRRRR